MGWTPTNVVDGIAGPFGALGDLLLIPDPQAGFNAQFGEMTERFMLGDIQTLEGAQQEFCTRSLLKSALERLRRTAGVRLLAALNTSSNSKVKTFLFWPPGVRGATRIVRDANGADRRRRVFSRRHHEGIRSQPI